MSVRLFEIAQEHSSPHLMCVFLGGTLWSVEKI
jgi:hypothetical protein